MPKIDVTITVEMFDADGGCHEVRRRVKHRPTGDNPRFFGDQLREALALGNEAIAPLIAAYDPKAAS